MQWDRNTLQKMGAVHVKKSFLDMLKSQMWQNCWFQELLLEDAYCIYAFF